MAKEPGPGDEQATPAATPSPSGGSSPPPEPVRETPQSPPPAGVEQTTLPGIAAPPTSASPLPPGFALETADEAPPEPVFTPFSLTVGDGFKFGCGLSMALTIAALIALLALSVLFLLASLVGAPLPIGR